MRTLKFINQIKPCLTVWDEDWGPKDDNGEVEDEVDDEIDDGADDEADDEVDDEAREAALDNGALNFINQSHIS